MPAETIEHNSGAASIEARATGATDTDVLDRDATRARRQIPASKPASETRHRAAAKIADRRARRCRRSRPGVWHSLDPVRCSARFRPTTPIVNGHVTFVAPRVHGQVSRVLVDDNNRVHKGDLLVELDKEPFRDAVAVKKAAVDTAEADLQAAKATVRGIEAQAWSRRWQLQQAVENVENQISPAACPGRRAQESEGHVILAQQEFDRTSKLVVSDDGEPRAL